MPIYGREKVREMCVAPMGSVRHVSSRRDKRLTHRWARHKNRQLCRTLRHAEGLDDSPPRFSDPSQLVRLQIKNNRFNGPAPTFIKWACKVSEILPIEERLAYVKAFLPNEALRQRVMPYLRYNKHFRLDGPPPHPTRVLQPGARTYWQYYSKENLRRDKLVARLLTVENVVWLLAHGYHSELNRELKAPLLSDLPYFWTERKLNFKPLVSGVSDIERAMACWKEAERFHYPQYVNIVTQMIEARKGA